MVSAKVARKAMPAKKAAASPVRRAPPAAAPASIETASDANPSVPQPKPKLVRDSFTIPKSEYLVLTHLKDRAAQLKRPTKKSELLRAGVAALNAMSDRAFLAALRNVPSLKTGRPKDARRQGDRAGAPLA